jgi:hypothetical protein
MPQITISVQYIAGIGWQYVVHRGNTLIGRYGEFETQQEAIQAGLTMADKVRREW